MPEFEMMPPHRARPRVQDLEQARRANRQAEYEHFARQTAMKDQLEQVVERIRQSSGSEMPGEFAQMMQVLMSMGLGPFHPPYPQTTMDQALKSFVRGRALALPGIYVAGDYPRMRDEVEIFDFTAMVQGATRIAYRAKGDPEEPDVPPPVVEIWRGNEVVEFLDGKVAEAFLGYLHYNGLFLVEAAKRPCPDCSDGPARDCETCGGLRWIIPADPEPEPRRDAMGRTIPPRVDDPAIEEASRSFTAVRDRESIQILLDTNLKLMSALQAIQRWCNSDADTPFGEALAAIEALVADALPGPEGPFIDTPADAHE